MRVGISTSRGDVISLTSAVEAELPIVSPKGGGGEGGSAIQWASTSSNSGGGGIDGGMSA